MRHKKPSQRLQLLLGVVFGLICSTWGSTTIDWSLYHTTDQILEVCQKLAIQQPGLASFEEIPDPDSQYRQPVLTISDASVADADKQLILLVAGEHSRELITSEIVFWLVSLFLDEVSWESAKSWSQTKEVEQHAVGKGWADTDLRTWARVLLHRVVFKIVPVLNIAGRKAVEGGNSCLRKTISGVDLNRNWPFAWEGSEPHTDEFGGFQPFSEPESRVIKFLARAFRPHAYVNLHSGEWAMYVPWDSKNERAPNLPADTEALLAGMNEFCKCMNGPAGQVAGYLAMGTSMDWMYAEHHIPYPLTFEVFGPKQLGRYSAGGHPRRDLLQNMQTAAESSPLSGVQNEAGISVIQDDFSVPAGPEQKPVQVKNSTSSFNCLPLFNPMTVAEYREVVASWIGSILILARHLQNQPNQNWASFHAEQLQQPEIRPEITDTHVELARQDTQDLLDVNLPLENTESGSTAWAGRLGAGSGRMGKEGRRMTEGVRVKEAILGYNLVLRGSTFLLIFVGVALVVSVSVGRLRQRGIGRQNLSSKQNS